MHTCQQDLVLGGHFQVLAEPRISQLGGWGVVICLNNEGQQVIVTSPVCQSICHEWCSQAFPSPTQLWGQLQKCSTLADWLLC